LTPTRPAARGLPGRGARRYPSRLGAPTPVRDDHVPDHGRSLRPVMAWRAVGAWRITQPMCDRSVSRSQFTATDSQCPRKPARLKAPARRSPPITPPSSPTQPGTTLRHVRSPRSRVPAIRAPNSANEVGSRERLPTQCRPCQGGSPGVDRVHGNTGWPRPNRRRRFVLPAGVPQFEHQAPTRSMPR